MASHTTARAVIGCVLQRSIEINHFTVYIHKGAIPIRIQYCDDIMFLYRVRNNAAINKRVRYRYVR